MRVEAWVTRLAGGESRNGGRVEVARDQYSFNYASSWLSVGLVGWVRQGVNVAVVRQMGR